MSKINLLSTRFHVCSDGTLTYNGLHPCLIGMSGEVALLKHPHNLLIKYKNASSKILFALEELKYKC